jgi:hypothetical protein
MALKGAILVERVFFEVTSVGYLIYLCMTDTLLNIIYIV